MPGFDGTGPAGAGRLTGWGRGPCGQDVSMDPAGSLGRGMGFYSGFGLRCGPGFRRGRGMGFGRGFGMGFGRGFGPGYGPGFRGFRADDGITGEEGLKAVLSEQKDCLKARLDAIDKRLETL